MKTLADGSLKLFSCAIFAFSLAACGLGTPVNFVPAFPRETSVPAGPPSPAAAVQIAQAACVSSWGRGDPTSFNEADWRVQSAGDQWRVWMDRAVDKRCFEVRIPKGGVDPAAPPNCLTCVAY